NDNILVNGRLVESVATALAMPSDTIPALQKELRYQASRSVAPVNELGIAERDVTIMGDKAIPYQLLRKIMMTCSTNEYSNISLAVVKRMGAKASCTSRMFPPRCCRGIAARKRNAAFARWRWCLPSSSRLSA